MDSFSKAESTTLRMLVELQQQMFEVRESLKEIGPLGDMKDDLEDLKGMVEGMTVLKDYYTTREVAELMGVTQHTVQVRWCAEGRIDCDKDPNTGRWRVSGIEYDRLRRGGKPTYGS